MILLRGRVTPGMTLAFVIVTACGGDRRDVEAESSVAADSHDVPSASGIVNAPQTTTSSDSTSSQGRGARSRAGGSPRDSSGARRPVRSPVPASSSESASASASEPGVIELRGTITVVGNAPVTQVQLQPASAASRTLTGPQLPSLRRIAGLEVQLSGTNAPGGELSVRDFTVLSADGQPALDGVLERDGATLYLRTAGGRVPLGNPPGDFHALAGARVWLTGSPERGPNAFGIITPAR